MRSDFTCAFICMLGIAASQTACAPRAASNSATERPVSERPVDQKFLQQHLTNFAHDSMLGRQAGHVGNYKATEYIARVVRELGLLPAGDNGTYFQEVPILNVRLDPETRVSIGNRELVGGEEFLLLPRLEPLEAGERISGNAMEAVYAGRLDQLHDLAPEMIAGRVVVIAAPEGNAAIPDALTKYAGASAILIGALQTLPPQVVNYFSAPRTVVTRSYTPAPGPVVIFTKADAITAVFGESATAIKPGVIGKTRISASGGFSAVRAAAPARNVVAVLPGSDSRLRGQYVALGAHNDHVGLAERPVDHDSILAYNRVMRPEGLQSNAARPDAVQQARIDSLYRVFRGSGPVRLDSVFNGADDDGSGSIALLGIAEALTRSRQPLRRSMLFVWHTGEELGMLGSEYFTSNPTVPLDSIVTQLNIDMIGRGGPNDLPGGGPGYLQLIGSRRLSTELGDLVEAVNTKQGFGFRFDYQYDAAGHPQNIYCRSDHASYARHGIPVTFFSTGVHPEYHQLTDEVEYIDFTKMQRVSEFIRRVAVEVSNGQDRPRVDQPLPNPNEPCRQ